MLSLIFTGAENPHLAAPATIALKDITRECKTAITPYAEQIARKTAVSTNPNSFLFRRMYDFKMMYFSSGYFVAETFKSQ